MFINKIIFSFSIFFSLFIGQGSLVSAQTSFVDQGNVHAKNGNYSQSLASLNQAIQSDPNSARAYKLRGHVYYAMGDYQKALADLDYVVHLIRDSANAYVDRAIVHSVMGNHGLALADVERALALKPSSTFAQSVRKEILERARGKS
jgi:tetratricopeptide (TPR) repeat protein